MNYSLNINLEGADDVDKSLDNLISKLGNLENIKMDRLIDASGILNDAEKTGEKIGDKVSKGIEKKTKDVFGKNTNGSKFDIKGILVGALATIFNPFVGARMLSNSIGAIQGNKKGGGSANGIFGLSGAIGYGEIFVSIKALSAAFNSLKSSVENARNAYAKSLTSGLGIEFTVNRSLLANILGVSETEVVKFGAAVNYLNPKLSHASKILSETTKPLTEVAWEFGVLKADLSAVFAKISNDASPAILDLIGFLDSLAISLSNAGKGVQNFQDFIQGYYDWFFNVDPQVAKADFLERESKKKSSRIPDPLSYMKQLPASSWEKMGLVMGGGNTTNDLIKKSNMYLKTIADAVKNTGGIPRAFGLDPATANP